MVMSATPYLWNIPYRRNPFFTGREDILNRLHHALNTEYAVALSQPQGITGLGGIGKTQTVVEYAYRHCDEYDAVFWVRADSVTSLVSSMVELAQILQLPERNEQGQEIIVQAVLRWLRHHSNWLLIYDNIDDLSLAEPYLPKAEAGHLLFTTRAHAIGGLAQRLDIQRMEPEIGALLLLRRASFLALRATLNMADPDDQRLAQAISQELDGLPLALDQAGAYIKETPSSLQKYLSLYQTRRGDILRVRGNFDQDYPASVVTTWSLSFEKISQAHPAAPELLNFCAFLAPNAIPEELLIAGAGHLGAVLAPMVTNPLQFDQICKEVLRFSLLQRGVDKHTLTIHRLVQAVLRDSMPIEIQQQWMRRAVHAVNATFPSDEIEFANWPICERLVPHAQACAIWISQVPLITTEAAHLLVQAGHYLHDRGRYEEIEPLYQRALAICEKQWGTDHSEMADNLNNLALLYRDQGRYAEAEPLFQRALAICEQKLGDDHLHTAFSLNNLALLYDAQGRYAEAEPLYQRALAICEQKLGDDHLHTAQIGNNLAEYYRKQRRYAEAEPLYRRALEVREQQLGTNNPHVANSLNNLALCYHDQERYAEVEPLYRRVLAIMEGTDHPDTALSLSNLAGLYTDQERYAEAEPLYQQALAICEQKLGVDHPLTAQIENQLAECFREQRQYAEAEPLHRRALATREQVLGASHPDTAQSLNNLALCYHNQERYAEAEPLYQRALAIREQVLEASHPDTALSLSNLAALYQNQGKYASAKPLYERALLIYGRTLGLEHPTTQSVQQGYTSLLESLKQDEEST
jgi:tetratricopeptide (TPR) repeat protein